MREWIATAFSIQKGGFVTDEATSDSFVFISGGSEVNASLDAFLTRFGAVPTPPTSAALKAVDPHDDTGWHRHFDTWVAQGIIQP